MQKPSHQTWNIGYGGSPKGHRLTGQVAQQLLTPETAEQVKAILSPDYGGLCLKSRYGQTMSEMNQSTNVEDRFNNDPKAYLEDIVDMTNGRWQLEASNWTYCDPSNNQGSHPWIGDTKSIASLCPIEWAKDINKLNCQYVWKDYDPHRDYSKHYFETMTGAGNEFLVQKLIAMSGVRMATILNQIYDPDNTSSTQDATRFQSGRT
ncbi:unnamed protein product [Mortierella alpina]